MKLVDDVFEIAESFMKNSKYVDINYKKIEQISKQMLEAGPTPFYIPELPKDENQILKGIIFELVAASVNYCYWYGRSDIRPGGASSTRMYELMMNSFFDFEKPNEEKFSSCIDTFIKALSLNRFPLLEEREKHLNELKGKAIDFSIKIEQSLNSRKYSIIYNVFGISYFFKELVENFPGFASDIFKTCLVIFYSTL